MTKATKKVITALRRKKPKRIRTRKRTKIKRRRRDPTAATKKRSLKKGPPAKRVKRKCKFSRFCKSQRTPWKTSQ